jgi:hypothetical protein
MRNRVPRGAFERLERYDGKPSRTVLRGLEGSNALRLPDPAQLTFEHDHLLAQKRVFGNLLRLATQQIGGNAGDLTIRSWFGPFLHLGFDLLKTAHDQLLAYIPELAPVHWNCPFHEIREKNHAVISSEDYTWYRRKSPRMTKVAGTGISEHILQLREYLAHIA